MAWGQITPYAKPEDFYKQEPEFWTKMGAEERKRSYYSDVANARKKVATDTESKRTNNAYKTAKDALDAQLKKAKQELADLEAQLVPLEEQEKINSTPVMGSTNSPTSTNRSPSTVPTEPTNVDQTPTFGNKQPITQVTGMSSYPFTNEEPETPAEHSVPGEEVQEMSPFGGYAPTTSMTRQPPMSVNPGNATVDQTPEYGIAPYNPEMNLGTRFPLPQFKGQGIPYKDIAPSDELELFPKKRKK